MHRRLMTSKVGCQLRWVVNFSVVGGRHREARGRVLAGSPLVDHPAPVTVTWPSVAPPRQFRPAPSPTADRPGGEELLYDRQISHRVPKEPGHAAAFRRACAVAADR